MDDTNEYLQVRVSRATENVWEGPANSVSSENSMGSFDILPMHANMITIIDSKPITVLDANGESHVFEFKQSVIYVNQNLVRIFANLN